MATSRKANVMPTARASMLVATAKGSMARRSRAALLSSGSSARAVQSILPPSQPSRRKATQWSMAAIDRANPAPKAQPAKGISP